MTDTNFRCFLVAKEESGGVRNQVTRCRQADLPEGDVRIRVHWSSLNYKDALAATGNPGVVRNFPHVPGIDAAGVVQESDSGAFSAGDRVICTSYELGAGRWGAWGEYIRVPAEWVIPLPDGLSLQEAMICGTAGFTAAQSVQALQHHGVTPERGEVVVTGATGGVGSFAVRLLAHLGYRVVAVSGKESLVTQLQQWGAARVVGRDELTDSSSRPLLSARWAGAVDCVGGTMLASLLRSTLPGGCVTACGLVAGTDLPLTVLPFILRGVTLAGIDSAQCPRERREQLWTLLAGPWKPASLRDRVTTVTLEELDEPVRKMLEGQSVGRVLVQLD